MRVGQVYEYPADQTITYGGLNGLGDITSGALVTGSRGDDVKKLQTWLSKVGYPITADGIYGAKTAMAVLFVQRKLNVKAGASALAENGSWDAATNAAASAQTQADIVQPNQTERGQVEGATAQTFQQVLTGQRPAKQVGGTTTSKDVSLVPSGTMQSAPSAAPSAQPDAATEGFMAKYESWLKQQAWLPEQLKNPYVAGGIVLGVTALLGYGLYKMSKVPTEPEAAPAMAGLGEWEMEKPKRKKRRKSRKSKK